VAAWLDEEKKAKKAKKARHDFHHCLMAMSCVFFLAYFQTDPCIPFYLPSGYLKQFAMV